MRKSTRVGMMTVAVAMLVSLFAGAAVAADYKQVASLTAGGKAKEVSVNRSARQCLLRVDEGSVIINTIVVRQGGNKKSVTVARKFQKGKDQVIKFFDQAQPITGLRISDSGTGRYRLFLK